MRLRSLLAALAGVICMAAGADPADRLPDPAQEARARAIFQDVRCLVCQNESIDDSEAELAADLRHIVRDQVRAGRTNVEIKRFLTDRYGEFVLLKPSFKLGNAILWVTPFAIVGLGAAGLLLVGRRRREETAPLDAEEQKKLDALSGETR